MHPAVQRQRLPKEIQHEHREGNPAAFRWSVLLNSALSGLQLAIGIGFGSLALIGDALHNLGDVAGLLLGWGAERLSARPANRRFTYGFGRSTQLASMVNAALILMASGVVIVEGIQRLGKPVEVHPGPVAWAALAGILVNLFSARLFGHNHGHDLNRKAAVVHLLTDAAVSGAVLVSAVLVGATGIQWLDPLTGIGVGLAVAWTGWQLLQQALVVALDGVPPGIDVEEVERTLAALEPAALDAAFPVPVAGVQPPTGRFLLHLAAHLAFHLGQVGYLRRALTGDPTSAGGMGIQELAP